MATAVCEFVVEPEGPCLRDAPRMHLLATHAVPKPGLALQDQDVITVLGEALPERGAREATSHRDHVVAHRYRSDAWRQRGRMFWLRWKTFSGSYTCLISSRRS